LIREETKRKEGKEKVVGITDETYDSVDHNPLFISHKRSIASKRPDLV